ncbi:hypothetical protein ILUMI_22477 [Ignelater luminosus]|uniref:Uncharacterized protein n=1 Tax=Ignelater luminosus TaxID=2038154 RepID=A0A8K0G2S7_IGNLU|nr:hypothetical protein ILUMI_22477 [Ignelater luminosus]
MGDSLLNQLKKIVDSIDNDDSKSCGPCGSCCGPTLTLKPLCSPPCPFSYLQVCMLIPPPEYVKPLTLPCSLGLGNECKHDLETDFKTCSANFYDNYNVDYHRHIAQLPDEKWTRILTKWRPRETKRGMEIPNTRWRNDIRRHAGASPSSTTAARALQTTNEATAPFRLST